MEEKKTFKEKKLEMREKYLDAIRAISIANNVDMGVAQDMLESIVIYGKAYPIVKMEDFKKDYEELTSLSK